METRRLQYFVQIVDAGSINRAAAVIGIAQPALSQQVAILESELKVRLLERSAKGVEPTEAGRRLYVRAQVILRQLGSLTLELGEAACEIAGAVAVGLPPSHGASLGNPLLAKVLTDLPRVRLQIVEDGATALSDKLQAGLLDMIVSPVRISEQNLEETVLFQEELFLVSAPQLASASLDPAVIANLPWIVTASPNAIRGRLNAMFTQADLEPNVVAEINSLPMVVRAVEEGLGVTLLPQAAAHEAAVKGRVVLTAFPAPGLHRSVLLYRPRNLPVTPAEHAVHRLLVNQARVLGGI